jgi:hypothetical protein
MRIAKLNKTNFALFIDDNLLCDGFSTLDDAEQATCQIQEWCIFGWVKNPFSYSYGDKIIDNLMDKGTDLFFKVIKIK